MWLFFVSFTIVGFAASWLETGNAYSALVITAWLTPLILVAAYFFSRQRRPASKSEAAIARTWVFVRRLICYTTAFVLGVIAAGMVYLGIKSVNLPVAASGVFFGLLSALAAWTGAYGAGSRWAITDDKVTHQERKARYRWK
jgi:hypothetical protein